MDRNEIIRALAELITDLQVPISLDGEMAARGGPSLLHKAQAPWTRLHRELVGFGYTNADELEAKLHAALGIAA
jgi:hypothetical protein